jgi:hypothetical protein
MAAVLQHLPPVDAVYEVDYRLLSERLAEIPDAVNGVLRLLDGRRTLRQVIAAGDAGPLATARDLATLHHERLIRPARDVRPPAPEAPPSAAAWFAGPAGEDRAASEAPGAAAPDGERDVATPVPVRPPAGAAPRIVRFPARRRDQAPRAADGEPAVTPSAPAPAFEALLREPPVEPLDRPAAGGPRPAGPPAPARAPAVTSAAVPPRPRRARRTLVVVAGLVAAAALLGLWLR